MKLVKALSLFAVGAGAFTLVSMQGCGSDGNTSSSSGTPTGQEGRTPPKPPEGAGPGTADKRTFAVSELYLGETDRSKNIVKDAWKEYGYNLDGLITAKDSKDVCTRFQGADSAKQEDGKEGIDNAFGRTILSFILGLVPTPSKTLNDSISGGSFTILLETTGLSDDPKQSATNLSARLLIGGGLAKDVKPDFASGNFDWPYRSEPIVPITGAYINNGTWVNGAGGATVQLSLFIQGVALSLSIRRAVITFQHDPATKSINNGTIAGVINREELVSGIEKVAGRISAQLCSGSTLDTIKTTIRQASDIMDDGSNAPGKECNAISIGIGFTGKKVGDPKTVATEGAPPPDPCTNPPTDGGTEGGQ